MVNQSLDFERNLKRSKLNLKVSLTLNHRLIIIHRMNDFIVQNRDTKLLT